MLIARFCENGTEQPLSQHLEAVSGWCSSFAQQLGLTQTGRLIGLLHDMGKAGHPFQEYIRYCQTHPNDTSMRGTVPHAIVGAKFIYETFFNETVKSIDNLIVLIVALTVSGHHSGLIDCVSPDGDQPLYDRLLKDDPKLQIKDYLERFRAIQPTNSDIQLLFQDATSEIKAVAANCREHGLPGEFVVGMLTRFLFSCLIDADRYDAYNFDAGINQNPLAPTMTPWTELSEKLERHLASLDSNRPINMMRQDISTRCKNAAVNPCGIYRLSVPTGGGKTLASLRFAIEHAKHYKKDRIFYIIPYTTIIDQNALAIRGILQHEDLILEHHSNVFSEDNNQSENRNNENARVNDHKLLTERWSSPIILTTMVQFMNCLYSGGTSAVRRMHHLTNSVLIFDEIQSVPQNCIHLLNSALNFLNRLGQSTIILCTATQPALNIVNRPLLLAESAQIVQNLDEIFRLFKRTHVINACMDGGYSIKSLCEFFLEKISLSELQTGLIIMNTKRAALECYDEICRLNNELPERQKYKIFHLSTGMCPAHRKIVLQQIRDRLANERIICVSTQLIEAGVDLSFQCVIRALAGLDSIAQAAGRCNRHGEATSRDVFIVNIAGENLKNLPEIQAAQDAARRVLQEMQNDPTAYGGDLLSPQAIEQYYQYLYQKSKNSLMMDYPVRAVAPSATIYDLVSANKLGCGALSNRSIPKPQMTQAFGTVGEHFRVIQDDTSAVLVPYQDGKSLIQRLSSKDQALKERFADIRLAQQYSVNIFSEMMKQLEKAHAIEILPGGLLALDEQYYSPEKGVALVGSPLRTIIV